MKTNSFARGILRIRSIVLCLTIVGLVGVEFRACKAVATRYAQYTVAQTGSSLASGMSFGEMMGKSLN